MPAKESFVFSLALRIHPHLCHLLVCNQCRVLQGCTFCSLAFLNLKWAALKPDFASAEVSVVGEVGWIPPSKYCVTVVIQVCLWVNLHLCDKCWTDQVIVWEQNQAFFPDIFFLQFLFSFLFSWTIRNLFLSFSISLFLAFLKYFNERRAVQVPHHFFTICLIFKRSHVLRFFSSSKI